MMARSECGVLRCGVVEQREIAGVGVKASLQAGTYDDCSSR